MKCDLCPKQAKVFFSQIVGSTIQKINLCNECAEEQGVTDPTGFALADVLQGVGIEKPIDRPIPLSRLTCPACGFGQADFKKTGRLGCCMCYITFRDAVENLLSSMHRGTVHTGKVPEHIPQTQATVDAVAELTTMLETAVAAEDYEEAARLRDQIRKLQPAS